MTTPMAGIFPKHPTADAYKVGASFTPYAVIAVDKRLADAELAAEHWAAMEELARKRLTSSALRLQALAATFQRFAQHAHFDEVTER